MGNQSCSIRMRHLKCTIIALLGVSVVTALPRLSTSRQSDVTTAEEFLKACYSITNNYYPPTNTHPSHPSLLPILAGAGGLFLLGLLRLGSTHPTTSIVGRSDIQAILAKERIVDIGQIQLPPFLQSLVQQIQSGEINSVDTTQLPDMIQTFIQQVQAGGAGLPPILQGILANFLQSKPVARKFEIYPSI